MPNEVTVLQDREMKTYNGHSQRRTTKRRLEMVGRRGERSLVATSHGPELIEFLIDAGFPRFGVGQEFTATCRTLRNRD